MDGTDSGSPCAEGAPDATGFYRHIVTCNLPIDEPFLPWRIDGLPVGWLRPAFAERLAQFPAVFDVRPTEVQLRAELRGFDTRSQALDGVARQLAQEDVTPPYMGESYAVTPSDRDQALCTLDRAAAAHFGVLTFGQHLNGFVRRLDGLHMWLARRALDRLLFPGALDNMVAGGLPHALGLQENLAKECAEEAGLGEDLAGNAVPVGVVSYCRAAPRGLRRDLLYCYDLELPDDFVPQNKDGEVEEFLLLPLSEVAAIVRETDQFKLNCNLVVIDFLIRHGWLEPDSPDYMGLVLGLRRPLADAMSA